MPGTGLPAREMLKLPGETSIAWAVFEASWYLASYPDTRAELGESDDAAVLECYLRHGQRRGHSPNIWFDEAWHLMVYPGVAAAVRDGRALSGFDLYCRDGFAFRSPHWLFEELRYRRRYPDLRDDVLAASGNANGYDHFLKHGSRERRSGHALFDHAVYRDQLGADEREAADLVGCYGHYLCRIEQCPREIRTSLYFDPTWYRRRYPEIAGGAWRCMLHHYLANDTPTRFDPLPEFSEAWYLARNSDVAAAVAAKDRRNGYDHFLTNGIAERRAPTGAIDLSYYLATHPVVRSDLDNGRARNAFLHYLTIGRDQGLATTPPSDEPANEAQAAVLNRRRAEGLLPRAARAPLDFSCEEQPDLSVIISVHDRLPLTLMTLGSLRTSHAGSIELILIDAGSTDDTCRIGRFVRGARVLRFDTELDDVHAGNAALDCVSADTVLFLDSAVELAPGSLAAALRRLRSDPSIGAVGGKLVSAHGRLEAAGKIVWRDGRTQDYLRGASPAVPEANFVRDIDGCAAAFLLARTEALRCLAGFDETFAALGSADVDLCLRIVETGARMLYDPAVVVTRLAQSDTTIQSVEARQALLARHSDHLHARPATDDAHQVFARSSDSAHRVLFIDDMVPLRQLGSGFVRSNDLIQVMASLGYRVTVYPIGPTRFGLAAVYADMPDTVEVMHDRTRHELAEFLAARRGYYDTIWVSRTHNLDLIAPMLEGLVGEAGRAPRIVLDTEAIAASREAGWAELAGGAPVDIVAACAREFANARLCHSIIAVSRQEAERLRDLGFPAVAVIGHWREIQPTPRAFAERDGMLFVGAMHEQGCPNRDALDWFVCDVLPLVERSLGWETRLTVAGYVDPAVSLAACSDHPRVTLRGAVDDLVPLYDTHRIFVAPTRYAAGVPYKVHESASFGLPVVASTLLARQLNWHDGRELLAADTADPAAFAQRVVTLYRDPVLWQTLRANAFARLHAENGRTQYEAAIRAVLEQSLMS